MGTQIMGVTADPQSARFLADKYFEYKPHWVKKYEPIYGSVMGIPVLLAFRTYEYTIEEQELMQSYFFRKLKPFHFLIQPSPREGDIQGKLYQMSIENFDKGIFPHPIYVPQARELLMARKGVEITQVLNEITSRKTQMGLLIKERQPKVLPPETQRGLPIWS